MVEQSTQTNNIIERPKEKADQKALLYPQKKKTKNEPDKEQDYIILEFLKKNEKESD